MELRIALRNDDLDLERLHRSTMELQRTLAEETEANVSVPAATAAIGAKGDPITVGTIVVTFLTSGAAVSIFKVLEAYVTRKRSIDIEITRPSGEKFVLHANDVSAAEVAATQHTFQQFVK